MSEQTLFFSDESEEKIVATRLDLINNSSLSTDQRMLLIICTTQQQGWQAGPKKILALTGWGEGKLKKEVRSLITLGYCQRSRKNDPASGHIVYTYKFRSKLPTVENRPLAQIDELVINQTNIFFNRDVVERGLLTSKEAEWIREAASGLPEDRAQLIVDELIGSLRARGRQPPNQKGIRNPRRYFSSLVNGHKFDYAEAERELREARQRAAKLSEPGRQNQHANGVPCPPEILEKILALRGGKHGK
jgi:hypothetical protein